MVLMFLLLVTVAIGFYLHLRLKKCESGKVNADNYLNSEKFFRVDLIPLGDQTKRIDFSEDLYLLFCFKSDCNSCLSNRDAWNQLAAYWESKAGKIKLMGIIPTGIEEAQKFQQKEHFPYPLYVPRDVNTYRLNMRLTPNSEHTILIYKKKVIVSRVGDLSGQDLDNLIITIKEKIQSLE